MCTKQGQVDEERGLQCSWGVQADAEGHTGRPCSGKGPRTCFLRPGRGWSSALALVLGSSVSGRGFAFLSHWPGPTEQLGTAGGSERRAAPLSASGDSEGPLGRLGGGGGVQNPPPCRAASGGRAGGEAVSVCTGAKGRGAPRKDMSERGPWRRVLRPQ